MSAFLENVNFKHSGIVNVAVPKEVSTLHYEAYGQLYVSQKGFVYNPMSKGVTWLKFLGIGLALPFVGIASKIRELAHRCFGKAVESKGYHDFNHVGKLLGIAWKAVVGCGERTIREDAEKFALAEVDYNNPRAINGRDPNKNRIVELDKLRSVRLKTGVYFARCMHPLFHESQYISPRKARNSLEEAKEMRNQLLTSLETKKKMAANPDWFSSLVNQVSNILDPFNHLSKGQVQLELLAVKNKILTLEIMIDRADKCEKYALQTILSQQTICDGATETVAECGCCNFTCYKHQRICGLVHKVDICGTRCWAIDCFCCMCCVWPASTQVCVI